MQVQFLSSAIDAIRTYGHRAVSPCLFPQAFGGQFGDKSHSHSNDVAPPDGNKVVFVKAVGRAEKIAAPATRITLTDLLYVFSHMFARRSAIAERPGGC